MVTLFATPYTTAHFQHPLASAIIGVEKDRSRNWASHKLNTDVYDGETAYTILAEMPGLGGEDVRLELHNRVLTVHGGANKSRPSSAEEQDDKKEGNEERTKSAARSHRSICRTYKRSFTLPDDVDESAICATMDKGVLELCLPKRKAAIPRQIQVTGPTYSTKNSAASGA
mmetsp:Transcript_39754/g.71350  ORF Transcript_39754/g.71350 Transcript_39754/m.71350 type:complete len:171 (-) Transcript_39754:2276-2788(-)